MRFFEMLTICYASRLSCTCARIAVHANCCTCTLFLSQVVQLIFMCSFMVTKLVCSIHWKQPVACRDSTVGKRSLGVARYSQTARAWVRTEASGMIDGWGWVAGNENNGFSS